MRKIEDMLILDRSDLYMNKGYEINLMSFNIPRETIYKESVIIFDDNGKVNILKSRYGNIEDTERYYNLINIDRKIKRIKNEY